MVVSFLKKLFGSGDTRKDGSAEAPVAAAAPPAAEKERPKAKAAAPVRSAAPVKAGAAKADQPDIEGFVLYVVRSLVDHPDQAMVKAVGDDRTLTLQVSCAKGDAGKIIGKSGKTIAAIRALANGAAGRASRKVQVEILD